MLPVWTRDVERRAYLTSLCACQGSSLQPRLPLEGPFSQMVLLRKDAAQRMVVPESCLSPPPTSCELEFTLVV